LGDPPTSFGVVKTTHHSPEPPMLQPLSHPLLSSMFGPSLPFNNERAIVTNKRQIECSYQTTLLLHALLSGPEMRNTIFEPLERHHPPKSHQEVNTVVWVQQHWMLGWGENRLPQGKGYPSLQMEYDRPPFRGCCPTTLLKQLVIARAQTGCERTGPLWLLSRPRHVLSSPLCVSRPVGRLPVIYS